MTPPRSAVVALVLCLPTRGLADPPDERSTSARARIGATRGEALLGGASLAERLRGIERLATVGTPRAVERMVSELVGSDAAESGEERLTLVRGLSAHAAEPAVRRALSRVLGGHVAGALRAEPDALDRISQGSAALSLARSGSREATTALAKALEAGGAAAEAAARALEAYPPREAGPLLAVPARPTVGLVEALSRLSDQRAFDTLRTLVRVGPVEVRGAALVALTELGDYETVEVARAWARPEQPIALRRAAARVLALAHDGSAGAAILSLFDDPGGAEAALELALEAASPALVGRLSRELAQADPERAAAVMAALGRAGGGGAASRLAAELGVAERSVLAAHALARTSGPLAEGALQAALRRPSTRRLAARAATVRALVLGREAPGTTEALETLLASSDARDRTAGAAGLSILRPARREALLLARDVAVAEGAATALLLAGEDEAVRVVKARGEELAGRPVAGAALVFRAVRSRLSTRALELLASEQGAVAALAVRGLAEREDESLRRRVDALLASADRTTRAAAALGLGRSPRSDATGRLAAAYRFEPAPEVRAAIVRALSERTDHERERTLKLAADLDPDPETRSVARRALSGTTLGEPRPGDGVVFVPVVPTTAGTPFGGASLTVEGAGGFVAPAWVALDGVAFLPGVPAGPVKLRAILPSARTKDP